MRTTRNPARIVFPTSAPTLEEQYDDPYSPLFGKRPRMAGLEPGIDPSSDVGMFRSAPAFQGVKFQFIDDLQASNALARQRGQDSYLKSVATMGPAFARFIDAASQMEDFKLAFIEPELQAMAAFYGKHVGKEPDDVMEEVVGVVYALTVPDGSDERPSARVRRVGAAFGERMKSDTEQANREKREAEEFLREKEFETQRIQQTQRRRMLEERGIIPSTTMLPSTKKNRRL